MVAAILATLMLLAPVALAADAEYDYAEDRKDAVATFSASDPDADASDIEWSLEGVDADIFEISDDGVLTFEEQPNFEDAKDGDEDTDSAGLQGATDNVYQVTVVASGGELEVAVTVTDVDEPGKVTFTQRQPQVSRTLVAMGPGDPDNDVDDEAWQWSRGPEAGGPWTDIEGATSPSRNPVADDLDMYLRATVTYTDTHGAQEVSGVTTRVEPRTLANAAPSFEDIDEKDDVDGIQVTMSVNENAKGDIGDPVMATDADNDVLLYSLADTPDRDDGEDARFEIDEDSAQISVVKGLNHETPADERTPEDTSETATNEADDNEYVIRVKATDPSGASETQDVLITVKDVNEAPEFDTEAAPLKDQLTLYVDENIRGATVTLRATEVAPDTPATLEPYAAEDDDNTTSPDRDTVTYKLEGGDDAKPFTIGPGNDGSTAALGIIDAIDGGSPTANFDHEKQDTYSITIVAISADAAPTDPDDRDSTYGRLNVTIKVVDGEDTGKVKLSAREPQIGRSVHATASDEDGGMSGVEWQWYRGNLVDDECAAADATGGGFEGWQMIDGAKSPAYTADSATFNHDSATDAGGTETDEVGYCLRATVTYTDNIDSDQDTGTPDVMDLEEMAHGVSEAPVQGSDPANTAPKFDDDQDLNTPGDQADAMRSVVENDDDAPVGDAVSAGDGNNDLLMYSLSGDDASSFTVNDNGQISTKVELDFETKSSYTVMLTATDPSGASDMINVMIAVTDGPDKAIITGVEARSYAEKETDPVATFSAMDPDADSDDIEWSLSGPDKDIFEISDSGVLTFEESPNFEDAKDGDESDDAGPQGVGDNVYMVTVVASDGELKLAVTVTDVDEPGKVTFTQRQAQISRGLAARGPGDPDKGVTDESWQWSRGESMEGPWTDIEGATSPSRRPIAADLGMYLRATVAYSDTHGAQEVSGVTTRVEPRTLANAAPSFEDIDEKDDVDGIQVTMSVNENAKGDIGDPVMATDADNDVLLYSLADTLDRDDGEDARFEIDEDSAQISVVKGLNWETPADEANTVEEDGVLNPADDNEYVIRVKATDPSGASETQDVLITVKDVNEAPEFDTEAAPLKDQLTLYIDENKIGAALVLRTVEPFDADSPEANQPGGYTAADNDNTRTGGDREGTDDITYTVEGADKKYFTIPTPANGELATTAELNGVGKGANFEKKSSYAITIVATSADGDDSDEDDRDSTYGRLDVTIKVVDGEDIGKVTLSAREPQVGRSVHATVTDEDGGMSGVEWQWYRGNVIDGDAQTDGLQATCVAADATDGSPSGFRDWQMIDGAKSPVYTADSDTFDHDATDTTPEVGYCLRATVTYTDDMDSDQDETEEGVQLEEEAHKVSEAPVQESDPANTAPKFDDDQDFNTPGDQADAMRSVVENDNDANVGDPVTAGDGNDDLLMYSLSGDDASSFTVDNNGQIKTTVELDFETRSSYAVMLTATDPSGAYDMIMVMITVLDAPDDAAITPNMAPAFDDGETAVREIAENSEAGTPVGDPVTATDGDDKDVVTYELGGDDAMYFAIGEDTGQITVGVGTMLDYESDKKTYMVTVTADDGTGVHNATDSIAVTIMVTDVNDYSPMFEEETAELMVAENTEAGMPVGDPLIATDGDDKDVVTYSLSDDDAMHFAIDDTGQITVGEGTMLDYESDKTTYMVTVTADDGTGAENGTGSIAVTIMVTDVNDYSPMFEEETAELMVAENTEAGMPVGDPLIATDGDDKDVVTYSLSGDDAMHFAIDDTGQITVGEGTVLDYESDKTTYMVTVTADDGTGADNATDSIAVTIMVTDVNDYSPMFEEEAAELMVAENTEAGMPVGDPLIATDGDDKDVVTYSLSGDDAMHFAIDDTGQITVGEGTMLDYESDKKMYMVTVTADDGTGADNATGSIAVTIMVTDVNDYSPMFEEETTEREVAENTEAGMPVGDPLIATDGDDKDVVTYSLSGDDAMYFAIVDDTGQITVGEGTVLDYESDKATYMVTVTADDGTGAENGTDSIAVTIMVIDNTPPAFPLATANRSVEENQEAGTAVGDPVTAFDVEGDTVTYLMESMYFEIDGEGQITTTMKLDYEAMASHTVTVTASNGEGSDSIEVTIMVIDNTPPAFPSATANRSVEENQEVGTAVGDPVTAFDVEGDTVTYLMESMYFEIDGEGQITTTMKLDYEAMASHTVTVTTSNGEGSDSIEVTIMVIDNTPPAFPSATANRNVEESQDAGTAVGDPVTASDVEGDTVTYSMESMYFEIDGEGQITTTMKLDYEAMASHTVTVTASNGEGSDSIEVTIRVIDNPPPAFPSATANRRVDENLYAGAAVGDPVAADDDAGDTVAYSIDGSDYFDIDTSTGQIMTTMKLDEEAMSSHSVTVTATDSGGETDSVRVAITVNDSQPGCDTVGDIGLVNDCEALLDSEDALGGSLNWADDTPMSGWDGVTMSGERVTAVKLNDQGLDGTIPAALGRLSELTSLNLRSNADLSGGIPGSLNYLSNLTVLNLHSNSHTGEIPDLSGTSLVELYLPGNELTGSVPAWLNTMADMTELWLWGNDLSGTLPDLSGMTSLDKLKLNGNTALTGIDATKLPGGLRWLIIGQTDIGENAPDLSGTSLTTLWMNETGLSGVIPVAGIPASLTSLNLKDNSLSGAIPDMSGLVNLVLLRLHRNELSGDMPGTMGDLESIEGIWIYDNELTGIAAGFANAADTLTHLYLSGNSFAEGTCLPGGLDMVANNDFAAAGLTACSQ